MDPGAPAHSAHSPERMDPGAHSEGWIPLTALTDLSFFACFMFLNVPNLSSLQPEMEELCKKVVKMDVNDVEDNDDVMHVEINVCDSLLNTLLMNEKSKDTNNARKDLKNLNIRRNLWITEDDNKIDKPHPPYSFEHEDRKRFCQFIKEVRLPDGFGSNFKKRVAANDSNITRLKSHDCHILMQRLLPVGVQAYLDKNTSTAIIDLCTFLKKICARTLVVEDMIKAQDELIKILCKLELIYPPTFFDIMIHLSLHLPEEAILGGPVFMRWMYPFERYMKKLKKYVRNKAKPEGSIAEGYVAEEALTFCSMYLQDVQTKFNRSERNEDDGIPNRQLSVFSSQEFASELPESDPETEFPTWFYNKGHYIKENNIVSINIRHTWYKEQPYILATQAKQVFYLQDPSRGSNWRVVEEVHHRKLFDHPSIGVVNEIDVVHDTHSSDFELVVDIGDLLVETDLDEIDESNVAAEPVEDYGSFINDEDEATKIYSSDDEVQLYDYNDDDDDLVDNSYSKVSIGFMALLAREHGGDGGNRPPFGGANRLLTSCESAKKKRGKGRNLNLIDEYSKNKKTPLPVVFDTIGETFKCVGSSHSMFIRLISNEIATSITPYYKSWAKVPASDKDRVYAKLNHFFNIDQHRDTDAWGEIFEGIQRDCASRYKGRKRKFKEHFLKFGGYGNVNRAKAYLPNNMDLEVWEKTIDKLFLDSKYRRQSVVNSSNKKMQEYGSNHGTSSIAQKRYEEGKILAELERQREAAGSSWDPSSVDEAAVLRNALGEGRCHNRGFGRKLKIVSRYPQPSQTTQVTSSTPTIAAMEEKMLGMQQVMRMMYYNMQQMQQALSAQNPNYQPPVQFNDPTVTAQNTNYYPLMQFNDLRIHQFRGTSNEETTSDEE
ncbi:hypothetical protein LXL04_027124 [Taraxacum kok-saghyz]